MHQQEFNKIVKNIPLNLCPGAILGCSPEWIIETLPKVVFANSASEDPKRVYRGFSVKKTITIGSFPLDTLTPDPLCLTKARVGLPETILAILSHSRFRKGSMDIINKYQDALLVKIIAAVEDRQPVKLVLPSLPFQNQNALCAGQSLDHIDLGVHLMFAQLRDLVLSVEAVYEPGLEIIIVCDGLVYADLLEITDIESVNTFRQKCASLLRHMGMARKIKLVDMSWLVNETPGFRESEQTIRAELSRLLAGPSPIDEHLRSLERGMLFNLPFTDKAAGELADVANLPLDELPMDIRQRLRDATLGYASFILALAKHTVVNRFFPEAIRATVHPKDAAQLPLHLVNKDSGVFPYNGVAVISNARLLRTGDLRASVRIMRLGEIDSDDSHLIKVVQQGQEDAFCYLEV